MFTLPRPVGRRNNPMGWNSPTGTVTGRPVFQRCRDVVPDAATGSWARSAHSQPPQTGASRSQPENESPVTASNRRPSPYVTCEHTEPQASVFREPELRHMLLGLFPPALRGVL